MSDQQVSMPTAAEFFDAIPEKESIIVGIAGPGGFGKSHFIQTCPNPVTADTEGRMQIVMKKFSEGNRYRKVTKDMDTIRKTISMMAKVLCPNPEDRSGWTFALDSASDFMQMAELEYLVEAKKDKVYPTVLWAKVYEKMDTVFDVLRNLGFNAVFTQQLAEIYRNEKPTGEFKPAGYKKFPYRFDVHLQLRKGIEFDGKLYHSDVVVAEVLKDCWHKPEETRPYLLDITYDGIFAELKPYKHPGDPKVAVQNIIKELDERKKIKLDTK